MVVKREMEALMGLWDTGGEVEVHECESDITMTEEHWDLKQADWVIEENDCNDVSLEFDSMEK